MGQYTEIEEKLNKHASEKTCPRAVVRIRYKN